MYATVSKINILVCLLWCFVMNDRKWEAYNLFETHYYIDEDHM